MLKTKAGHGCTRFGIQAKPLNTSELNSMLHLGFKHVCSNMNRGPHRAGRGYYGSCSFQNDHLAPRLSQRNSRADTSDAASDHCDSCRHDNEALLNHGPDTWDKRLLPAKFVYTLRQISHASVFGPELAVTEYRPAVSDSVVTLQAEGELRSGLHLAVAEMYCLALRSDPALQVDHHDKGGQMHAHGHGQSTCHAWGCLNRFT